jgi:uncharacterized membrane protein
VAPLRRYRRADQTRRQRNGSASAVARPAWIAEEANGAFQEITKMDIAIARIVHVLSVVLWIGGVGFVTTVLFPSVRRRAAPEQRLAAFLQAEERFVPQARISVLLAGLSGLYMTAEMHAWDRFTTAGYWWMHAMVCLWLIFAAMLFVIEPLFLHRRMERIIGSGDSARAFDRMERFHRVMLLASLVTVLGAVGGSHGLFY